MYACVLRVCRLEGEQGVLAMCNIKWEILTGGVSVVVIVVKRWL